MLKKSLLVCLIILSFTSIQAQSYYNTDVSISGSSTDNLFKNSSDIKEHFSSYRAALNLYPIKFVQFNLFSEYTNYGNNTNLTNLKYGSGITLLPLSDLSKFTLLLNTKLQQYSYKNAFTTNSTEFSNKDINGIISLGYQLDEKTYVRSGFSYNVTGYASDSVTDKINHDLFAGMNYSFLGSNTIDIETGYSFEKYDYLPEYDTLGMNYGLVGRDAYSLLENSDLTSFYLSLRLSRPIGNKTGVSFTFFFREFIDEKDSSLLLGNTTNYLSPWLSSYEGNSIQTKIKTYLIPWTILNFGVGYWNSSYLKTLESVEVENPFTRQLEPTSHTMYGENRDDEKLQMYFTLSIPIVTSSGRLFEPTLNLDYTDNNSTIANYAYTSFSVSINLYIK